MLDAWGDHPAVAGALQEASDALGEDLGKLVREGPKEALALTTNTQPVMLAAGIALWRAWKALGGPDPAVVAGHSLGEYTAMVAAGVLDFSETMKFVRLRARVMQEAVPAGQGAMAAILGLDDDAVRSVCMEASAAGIAEAANYNSPGQVVISGEIAAVERAMEMAKAAGAKRAIRLNVSGAFHSPLMEVARGGLERALDDAALRDPTFPVYANVTAEPVHTATDARRLLLEQLTAPVAWTRVVERLAADYPDALYVEMGPGNVLTGLVKKIVPTLQTTTCGTVAEVDQLLARVA